MRVKMEYVVMFEALDNREWGASWGIFTTKEEAMECVKENNNKWTSGIVEKRRFEIPCNLELDKNQIIERLGL